MGEQAPSVSADDGRPGRDGVVPPVEAEPTASIEWESVTLVYPAVPPVTAIQQADLRFVAGEQVALVGPSGSGKTTALNILGLLDRPTAGTYRLFGRNTTTLGEVERAAMRADSIGFVFQAFHLLPQRSALENVMLGMLYGSVPRRERRQRAEVALERVGLSHRAHARCATLSGGERQRTAIARAICHRPRLLLADEPTGNLDERTGAEILDLLTDLLGPDLLQVVVTHDPNVARRCRRQVRIIDGRVQETT